MTYSIVSWTRASGSTAGSRAEHVVAEAQLAPEGVADVRVIGASRRRRCRALAQHGLLVGRVASRDRVLTMLMQAEATVLYCCRSKS